MDKSEAELKSKPRVIVIEDKGNFTLVGFRDVFDALGRVQSYLHPDRVIALMNWAKLESKKHAPIEGHIVVHEGGECKPRRFHSPYELIGFIMANMGQDGIASICDSLTKEPPEKFTLRSGKAEEHYKKLMARENVDTEKAAAQLAEIIEGKNPVVDVTVEKPKCISKPKGCGVK